MKELKVEDQNVCPAHGRKGKVAKTAGRAPLSNTTNKLGQKCRKMSQQSEDENSLQLKKMNKKSGFTVLEDPAGSAETEPASPARPVAVSSDQQTQTEPQQSSDEDRLVADITAEEPSGQYWRQLAGSRKRALDEALSENQELHQRLATLEEENRLLKDVAQQAEDVMAAVQEWSEEQEQETDSH